MLNPKTNVCKLGNRVLYSLFARFQDGAKIIQNLTLLLIHYTSEYLWGFCVGLCFVMHLFVFFLFFNSLTRKRMIVTLL